MALFVKAEPCHHEKTMAACPMHSPTDPGDDQDSKNCCDDEAEYVKSDLDQITTSSEVELSFYPDLFSVHSFTFDIELPSVDKQSIQYLNYKPPLLVCDLPVRLQTFLC